MFVCPPSEKNPKWIAAGTFRASARSPSSPKTASARLSQLLSTFDSKKVHILALAVIQGFDCAIVRFVFNDTDAAAKELVESNYRFTICDLVAVEMPPGGDGLAKISKALLGAEIDIHYCYALITSDKIRPSIVVHVDNPSLAAMVLAEEHFHLLDESDLRG